jgi:hypothetical protein
LKSYGAYCRIENKRLSIFEANMFDSFDRILEQEEEILLCPSERQDWRRFVRDDPFISMRDEEFRLRFRFSKENVIKICDRITPHLAVDNRSHALSPLQMLLLTLSNLSGDEFQTRKLNRRITQVL